MAKISQEASFRQRFLTYKEKHPKESVVSVCIRYHISRKQYYKWHGRWDGTPESLEDHSRAPIKTRNGHDEDMMKRIKRVVKKYKWRDIILAYQEMKEKYDYPYCYQTFKRKVNELQEVKGCKAPKKRKNKPYQRAEYPGQKVQIDVKFMPTECLSTEMVARGEKEYVYVAIDECSRWSFREVYNEHSTFSSQQFLTKLVKAAPFQIRMIQTDNGTEFTKRLLTDNKEDLTLFEQQMKDYGIMYHLIRPGTPRHNGKVERQNRIDQERLYDHLHVYVPPFCERHR